MIQRNRKARENLRSSMGAEGIPRKTTQLGEGRIWIGKMMDVKDRKMELWLGEWEETYGGMNHGDIF